MYQIYVAWVFESDRGNCVSIKCGQILTGGEIICVSVVVVHTVVNCCINCEFYCKLFQLPYLNILRIYSQEISTMTHCFS